MRHLLGLRPRLLVALLLTSAVTIGAAALSLLPPLQDRLRDQSASSLQNTVLASVPRFTGLIGKGCMDAPPLRLLGSWSRHTLVRINRWLDDGFLRLHAAWRERAWGMGEDLPDGSGTFMGLDELGGMLVKTPRTTELRPLTSMLEASP